MPLSNEQAAAMATRKIAELTDRGDRVSLQGLAAALGTTSDEAEGMLRAAELRGLVRQRTTFELTERGVRFSGEGS